MIATFYSYKGGTGRTMAMANIAGLLSRRGKRVLVVDFDLEAPGLWRYFSRFYTGLENQDGLIDLLLAASSATDPLSIDWRNYVTQIPLRPAAVSLMTSGRSGDEYPSKVLEFDWGAFFRDSKGGEFFERVRTQWQEEYDFTLIDSRTGITDTGGICTILLPDFIVPVFSSNLQSLEGIVDVITRAQAARRKLAYDRPPAAILPILSRFDSRTEYESAQEWLDIAADRLRPFYEDWLPLRFNARQALERTKLPYVAYFSFGETMPALTEGVSDPDSLGYALNAVSQLIEGGLGNAELILSGSSQAQESRLPGSLPPLWKAPPRNPNFVGREAELEALARSLIAGSTVMVRSVRGMAGVGKSQLVTEFAYAHADDYELVWWIGAEETSSIPDQFAALAAQLGLDPADDSEILRVQVYSELRNVPGWLLIFANVDTIEDIQPWLPTGPVSAEATGHVIVTTRRGGFSALGPVLDLDVIGLDDAVRLLRRRVPGLDEETGKKIAQELGQLPLALEQAAAYLDISQMPADQYLQLLRMRTSDLLGRGSDPTGSTIATLWDISLERLNGQSPAAVQLLTICAYFASEPIPLDLFTTHPNLMSEPLSSAATDPLSFTDTVAAIVDYSLAKRTTGGLQIHRLIQATIRARYHFQLTGDPLPVALGLLQADAPGQVIGAPEEWPRWAVLLPHVLAATSHLDDPGVSPDPKMMSNASWLLDRAGAYLYVRARLADAKSLLEHALAITEAAYGPDHPDVATA